MSQMVGDGLVWSTIIVAIVVVGILFGYILARLP